MNLSLQVAVFAVLSLTLATPSSALEQIIRPYQSIRSAGMGGVKITTGEYEENFWGNPARVAFNPKWRLTFFDFSAET